MKKNQSHYDNLKQKGGKGSKAREFYPSKGWSDNFRKRFDLKYQNNSRSNFWEIKRQEMHSQMPLRKSLGINLVSCKFTNSLMSSSSFLVASLGFSMSSIMPSANSASFSGFPTWIPFIKYWFLKKKFFSFKEMVIDWRKACLNKWNASEIRKSP